MKIGPIDKHFAEMIREAREAASLSQGRTARMMTGYGFPWAQQTVARVETGIRGVSIGEAATLARALHFDTRLSDLGASFGPLCDACSDSPPAGFTCNTCGRAGSCSPA